MTYLVDVSVLVSLIWESAAGHEIAKRWRADKKLALCPIVELGFLRVSMSPAFNATMADARKALEAFRVKQTPDFIPADISALRGQPAPSAGKSTDWYLANLAQHHGMKWATLDQQATHSARELVA